MDKETILNNLSSFLDQLTLHTCDQFKRFSEDQNNRIGSLVESFEKLNLQFDQVKHELEELRSEVKKPVVAEAPVVVAEAPVVVPEAPVVAETPVVAPEPSENVKMNVDESDDESESVSLVEKMLKPPDGGKRRKFYITDDDDREIYEILEGGQPSENPIGKLVGKNNRTHFYKN